MVRTFLLAAIVHVLSICTGYAKSCSILITDTRLSYSDAVAKNPPVKPEAYANAMKRTLPKTYICASVYTMQQIRDSITAKKIRLLNNGPYENTGAELESAANMASAEYILTSSISDLGSQWVFTVRLIDVLRHKVIGEGNIVWDGPLDVNQMVDAAMKQVYEDADLCYYNGTISITEHQDYDSTQTRTEKYEDYTTVSKENERIVSSMTCSVNAKKVCNKKYTSSGEMTINDERTNTVDIQSSGDVICFEYVSDCSISDRMILGKFKHYSYKRTSSFSGTGTDNYTCELNFIADSGTYLLSVYQAMPTQIGNGKASVFEQTESTCGKCISKDEKTDFKGSHLLMCTARGKGKKGDKTLSGSFTLYLEKGLIREVSWQLSL